VSSAAAPAAARRAAAPLRAVGRVRFRPATVLFTLAAFTSSFDIFLTLDVGFNFRIAQLFLGLAFLLALEDARRRRARMPLGFGALCLWTAFIVAFVPNTTLLTRSAGYAFWLVFNVVVIFAAVQLFRRTDRLTTLLRWYLYSFAFCAAFGVVQLLVSVAGLGGPLVRQWWFVGVLPRVNGFSYEPSFYATYLLIGWTLALYLIEQRSYVLMPLPRLRAIFLGITVALVISTSRMGWLMMGLWCSLYPLRLLWHLLHGRLHRRFLWYSLGIGAIGVAVAVVVISVIGVDTLRFLVTGLGIGGAAEHSVSLRTKPFSDVLRVFAQSPIVGHSLGGVSPAIARLNGWTAGSLAAAKESEGINVFAEVLAGSGVIGVIPFVVYLATLIWKPLRLASRLADRDQRTLLRGMVAALLMELVVLQFNQNILRLYLWLHIALLSALYAALRAGRASDASGARAPSAAAAA